MHLKFHVVSSCVIWCSERKYGGFEIRLVSSYDIKVAYKIVYKTVISGQKIDIEINVMFDYIIRGRVKTDDFSGPQR
jgi:hypothetical protein